MRNWWHVWLGVVLAVLVSGHNVGRVAALQRLGRHVALTLLEHGRRSRLILAVVGHNLLELVVLVVNVLNLLALRGNQQPLVHVNHVNVDQRVILLQTLGVGSRLVASWEAATNLHAQLLILLRQVRAHKRHTCKKLSWYSQIILL